MRFARRGTGALKLAAIATFLAVQVCAAGDWWILGFQAWLCAHESPRETWYAWTAVGSDCHNVGAEDHNCTFNRRGVGMIERKECGQGRRKPHFIQSLHYTGDKEGSDQEGCLFYPKRNCKGKHYAIGVAHMNGCYEFRDRVKSFKCQ